MSKTIDEKVVSMQFDNRDFEKNVRTSMSTLDKLKHALKLDGVKNGLEDISHAAKKVNVSPISKGVEAVQAKFSALEVMAVTTLANITNSAVNTGKRLIAAFTIDPIKTGFQEYETQINAIQTILANTQSKGTTLDQVNAALDELNRYADKTIYNFTEMTRNIGTFTAAGIDLDTSVKSIQGIANLAAISGSNAQQASTAMYQLSQALAAGTVKLMDWNSVVNAGMGGQVFQDALKETARVHGIAIDKMIADEGSFRETLQNGWLSAEILNETLEKFTMTTEGLTEAEIAQNREMLKAKGYTDDQIDAIFELGKTSTDAATKVKTFSQLMDTLKEAAQSGWTQTWELIVGDFEEAKTLFTEISDAFGAVIQKSADARNALLGEALSGPEGKWEQLTEKVNAAGIATEDFQNALIETGKAHGAITDEMIQSSGSFVETLKSGWLTTDIVVETLNKFADQESDVTKNTAQLNEKLEYFQKVVDQVWNGDYKNGKERIEALSKAGYKYNEVQNLVNKTVDGHRLTLDDLSEAQLIHLGYTEEEIKAIKELADQADKAGTPINELISSLSKPSGRELLIDTARNALKALAKVIGTVKEAWRNVFPPTTATQLYGIIESIHAFSEKLIMGEETSNNLRRTLEGLFSILGLISDIVGGVLNVAFHIFSNSVFEVNSGILGVTAGVGDAITAFRKWTKENKVFSKFFDTLIIVFDTAKEIIGNVIKSIKEWFESFAKLPEIQAMILAFKDMISDTFKSINENFSTFIENIKHMDEMTLDDITNTFKKFKDNAINYLSGVDLSLDGIKTALSNLKGSLIERLNINVDGVSDSFDSITDKATEFATLIKEKIPAAIAIGMGIATIKSVNKIAGALKTLAGPLEILTDIGSGITSVLKSLKGFIKAKKFEAITLGVRNLAISIAILAGALYILSNIDQDKLRSAVVALSVIMVALALLSKAVSKINNLGDVAKGSLGFLAVAGSLLILVGALKKLESIKDDNLGRNISILAGMLISLGIVIGVLGKINLSPTTGTNLLGVIGLAASLYILVKTLKKIDELDLQHVWKDLGIMAGLILELAALTQLCKGIKFTSALGVIAIVMSLNLLLGVIDKIANFDVSKITNNIGSFITIFGMFAILMKATSLAGQNASQGGIGILAMSAAILILIEAIEKIAKLDSSTLSKGILVIGSLFTIFGMVVTLSHFAGANAAKAGLGILAMSGSILILVGAIWLLKDIEQSYIEKAIVAIGKLMTMFAGLMVATKFAKECLSTLIVLTVAVGVMAGAIWLLSNIDESSLNAASKSMSMVMAVFAGVIASTKLLNTENWWKTLVLLGGLTLVVAAFAGIITYMANNIQNADDAIKIAASLSTLLLSLSASCLILKFVGPNAMAAMPAAGIMLAITAGLAIIIGVLAKLNVGPTLEIAESLSILLLSLSAACGILALVGLGGPAAFVGIGALATLIVAVGGLMYKIGELSKNNEKMEEFLDKGIPILKKIGTGLGEFFGSMVDGFIDAATSNLGTAADRLSDFMNRLQPFITGIKSLNENDVNAIDMFVNMVSALSSANLKDKIVNILPGDSNGIIKLSSQLSLFANAVCAFSDKVSGHIDAESVKAASQAGQMIADMSQHIPKEGGLVGRLMGENSIAKFSNNLEKFGTSIVKFSDTVTGRVNDKAVKAASQAGQMIADMSNKIPNEGGLAAYFMGDNSLCHFGNEMVLFANAIVLFSKKIVEGNINKEAIENAKNAAALIVELSNGLPNENGKLQKWFGGKQSLGDFSNNMNKFGKAIVKFSEKVKDVNEGNVQNAANAGSIISELVKNLPENDDSWWEKITGGGKVDDFKKSLATFGEGISDFSNNISDVNMENVTNAVSACKELVNLANTMSGTDFTVFDTFNESLSNLASTGIDTFIITFQNSGEEISGAGSGIALNLTDGLSQGMNDNLPSVSETFTSVCSTILSLVKGFFGIHSPSTVFSEIGENLIQGLINGVNNLIPNAISTIRELGSNMISSIGSRCGEFLSNGSNIMTSLRTGISNKLSAVKSSVSNVIQNGISAVSSKISSFRSKGSETMESLKGGISGKLESVKVGVQNIVSGAVSAIKDKLIDFTNAGKELIEGFISGIASKVTNVATTAGEMARSAYESAKNMLRINSPSKVFRWIGSSVPEGFIKGIGEYSSNVKKATEKMANTSIIAARKTLGVNSPSIEFATIGMWCAKGYSEGLLKGFGDIKNNLKNMFGKVVDVASSVNKAWTEEINKITKTMGLGSRVFSIFVDTYTEKTLDIEKNNKILKNASNAVNSFVTSLYLQSDAYKDALESAKENQKTLDMLAKQRKENADELKSKLWVTKYYEEKEYELRRKVVDSLTDQTDEGKERTKQLKAEHDQIDKQLRQMNAINTAYDEKNTLEAENVEIEEKIKELNSKNSNTEADKAEISALEEKKKANEDQIKVIKDYIDADKDYINSIADKTDEYRSNISTIDENRETLKKLQNQEKSYKNDLRKANVEYTGYINKYNELSYALTEAEKDETEAGKDRVKVIKEQIDVTTKNIKMTENSIKTYSDGLEKTRADIKITKEYIQDQEEQIALETKRLYDELKQGIASKISDFLDPMSLSISSGINNIFNSFKSVSKTTTNYISNLFSEFSKKSDETTKDILNNMKSQVDGVDKWKENLVKVSEAGFDEGLVDYLYNLGVSGASTVELFAKMSKNQIEQANELFRRYQDQIVEDYSVSTDDILTAMESNIKGVANWKKQLDSLSGKVSDGLLKKLREMGPSAVDEINAFTRMTEDELEKANKLFADEQKLSGQALLDDFEDKANIADEWIDKIQQIAKAGFDQGIVEDIASKSITDGLKYMDALLSLDPSQVASFNEQREKALKIPDDVADRVIAAYAYTGSEMGKAVRDNLKKEFKDGSVTDWVDVLASKESITTNISESIQNGLSEASTVTESKTVETGNSITNKLSEGIEQGKEMVKTNLSTILNECVVVVNNHYNDFVNSGKYIVEGLSKGMNDNASIITEAARSLAYEAYRAAMEALDAHSPSKVFEKVGSYIPEGLMIGMNKLNRAVSKSSENMANSAIDSTRNVISRITDIINSDVDVSPTIRPVYDSSRLRYADIQLGANIDASLSKPISSMSQIMYETQAAIDASNKEVANAVNGLRDDLNTLYSSDDKEIALYVDSKKMASTLAKPMNRQLSILSKRGAY